jgi:hypothetical protein
MDSGWAQAIVAVVAAIISIVAAVFSSRQAFQARRQADAAHGQVEPAFHIQKTDASTPEKMEFCFVARNFAKHALRIYNLTIQHPYGTVLIERDENDELTTAAIVAGVDSTNERRVLAKDIVIQGAAIGGPPESRTWKFAIRAKGESGLGQHVSMRFSLSYEMLDLKNVVVPVTFHDIFNRS